MVLLLWIRFVIYVSCLSLLCRLVCSLQSPAGKALTSWLSLVCCVFLSRYAFRSIGHLPQQNIINCFFKLLILFYIITRFFNCHLHVLSWSSARCVHCDTQSMYCWNIFIEISIIFFVLFPKFNCFLLPHYFEKNCFFHKFNCRSALKSGLSAHRFLCFVTSTYGVQGQV